MLDTEFYFNISIALNIFLIAFLFHQRKLRAKLLIRSLTQTVCFADTVLQLRKATEKDKGHDPIVDISSMQQNHNSIYNNTDNDFFAEPIEELDKFVSSLSSALANKNYRNIIVPWTKI